MHPCVSDGRILRKDLSGSYVTGREDPISNLCDLHIHTTASDGQYTPQQVVSYSHKLGLRTVSICDHDTVSGYEQLARVYPTNQSDDIKHGSIEVIPGIEINSQWGGREIHILGYFIDPDNHQLSKVLSQLRESRHLRIKAMVEKLNHLGIQIELCRVLELSKGESVGRPHVAEAMIEKGYISSIEEGFDLYLGIGRPAYVERFHLNPVESIKVIRQAKGIAVWAHPGTANADYLLHELVENGLQGIEVCHPEHDHSLQQRYWYMARENKLLITGGSDFHSTSSTEGAMIGSHGVSYESVEIMKQLVGTTSLIVYSGI